MKIRDGKAITKSEQVNLLGDIALNNVPMPAIGGLREAQEAFGLYANVARELRGTGMQAHHLIEQRFARLFEANPRSMLSMAVTREEHQVWTNLWRQAIPYRTGTATATPTTVFDLRGPSTPIAQISCWH